ncbi:molybdenum cofactor cytidylyltransferase [Vallitalea longa]|uniref:Molybdenum cofactor cytidylyltransferase n=1 Tax=Vallitalea longa TaxID=2936439 RepID=A0A9W5YCA7_9FIRM|nr:molybdenum cofactor cytidylyltransferase [Vallitalea longa]GKX30036.1 molybdenum cofactor cytidylyltransferase [Vallitalea longa]
MITAIILAAGFSRRFKEEKLLIKLNNKPLISYVVETVVNIGFEEIILVYRNKNVKRIIENHDIKYAYNEMSSKGMSSSLRCGLKESSNTDGYMFINGDQPFLTISTIKTLIKNFHERNESIIVPRYNGKRGNPVMFSSKWKEELMNVTGDIGGRNIIKNNPNDVYYVDIAKNICGMDIDTWEDYLTIKELMDNE